MTSERDRITEHIQELVRARAALDQLIGINREFRAAVVSDR
jgi:hypothetical protein